MGPVDIAVIVVVSVAVLCAVGYIIFRKVKHKGGCCDCEACSHCSHCCESKKHDD